MKRALNGKVVNLRSFVAGRAAAEELQKQVVTEQPLAGCLPAHAAYVCAQNQGVSNVGTTYGVKRDGAVRACASSDLQNHGCFLKI